MGNTRKLVLFSLLVTMGTALHTLELMLPNPLPLPGAKLGLANIVTLMVLFIYGIREALAASVLRVLFASLITGTLFSVGFLLSMTGALLSLMVMGFLVRYMPVFSIIGVSIAGAIAHNVGQVLLAAGLIQTGYIFFYLPFLLLAGIPTGYLTGITARLLNRYLADISPGSGR